LEMCRELPDSITALEESNRSAYEQAIDDFLMPVSVNTYLVMVAMGVAQIDAQLADLKARMTKIGDGLQVGPQPEFGYADFLYLSVMTQSTVGASDILPDSDLVRLLFALQSFASVIVAGFLVGMIAKTASPHPSKDGDE
jgi:uncharacterized membrane protein